MGDAGKYQAQGEEESNEEDGDLTDSSVLKDFVSKGWDSVK